MKIGIIAGEHSGDLLGAGLISTLKLSHPQVISYGIGGPAMEAQGCQSLYEMTRLSVMGLVEPLRRLPELFKMRRQLVEHFVKTSPDVFIGIDSPDFNLGLELQLRAKGIPVVHYVSPSVWAWRKKRIHKIAKATDLMLTLFPFEADFYHEHGVPVHYVGHPLADLIPLQPNKKLAREQLQLDSNTTYIALLPGSRRNELKYLAPVFLEAAKKCWQQKPQVKFITSAINTSLLMEFRNLCHRHAADLPIEFFHGRSHEVLAASDIVLVTSGTATLETMLFKRPMVIAYRMHSVTYSIAKHLVKLPFIGLPNLLANKYLVPEFVQDQANAKNLSEAIMDYINHPEKIDELEKEFLALHQILRRNANFEAAQAVQTILK